MLSSLVPLFKGKGDPLNPNSYKGIKLLEHTFKLYEFGKMQYGFMPERGTVDAVFVLRRLVRNSEPNCIYLEKAFDSVPRGVNHFALRRS